MPDRPQITVDPAMRSGQPCLNGVTVDTVVGAVWAEGVDATATEYGLDRAAVLVCCWYAGSYGLPGRTLAATPLWRRRWGGWAGTVAAVLWSAGPDYNQLPDPPRA